MNKTFCVFELKCIVKRFFEILLEFIKRYLNVFRINFMMCKNNNIFTRTTNLVAIKSLKFAPIKLFLTIFNYSQYFRPRRITKNHISLKNNINKFICHKILLFKYYLIDIVKTTLNGLKIRYHSWLYFLMTPHLKVNNRLYVTI